MAAFTERLELLITSSAKGVVKDITAVGTATEELTAKQKLLGAGQNFVNNQLSQFGITAGQTGTALKVAGGALAAFGAVKVGEFAFDAAKGFAELGAQIRGVQRVTGTSAESASQLVALTKALGVNTDTATNAFFQLGKRIGQNKDTLDEHGASVIRAKDGTVDMAATIENAAVAFQKIQDPAERDAFLMENFGRTGKDLAPILSKTREEIEKIFGAAAAHHEILSQGDLDRTREFSFAMRELGQTTEGFKHELGALVIPIFTKGAETATGALTTFDKALGEVGGNLGDVGDAAGTLAINFTPVSNVMHVASAASALFAGNFGDAALNIAESVPLLGNAVGVFDDLTGVFGGGSDAATEYADSTTKLKDAQSRMLELAAEGKTGTKEYADAQAAAAAAGDTLAASQTAVADAMQSVAEKEFAATQQHLLLAQAGINLTAAGLAVKGALDDEAKAQKDANDAAQFGIDQSDAVQGAHLKTETAILGVIAAAQDRAVQALGPGATAEDIAKAKTDATSDALAYLAATTPNATGAIHDLGYEVIHLPDGHTIVVTTTAKEAADQVAALTQAWKDYLSVTGGNPARYYLTPPAPAPGMVAVPAAAGAQLAVVPSAAPTGPTATPSSAAVVTHLHVTVNAGGLGADAPQIQRAVVNALRGYTRRNGPLDIPVRNN